MTPELQAAVEKAARQLAANRMLLRGDATGARLPDELWQQCSRDALAAIRAVAEATQEHPEPDTLREAVLDALSNGEGECRERDMPKVWRAMHAASVLGEALRDE